MPAPRPPGETRAPPAPSGNLPVKAPWVGSCPAPACPHTTQGDGGDPPPHPSPHTQKCPLPSRPRLGVCFTGSPGSDSAPVGAGTLRRAPSPPIPCKPSAPGWSPGWGSRARAPGDSWNFPLASASACFTRDRRRREAGPPPLCHAPPPPVSPAPAKGPKRGPGKICRRREGRLVSWGPLGPHCSLLTDRRLRTQKS